MEVRKLGNLANAMGILAGDIVSTYDDRMTFVGDLKQNTGELLNRFHVDHSKMSEDLNGSLSRFVKNLSDSTGSFLKDFRKSYEQMARDQRGFLNEDRNKISTDVSKMLKKFHSEHQKMGKGLRNDLKSFSRELNEAVGELSKKVKFMRKEMRDDIAGASQAWRKMSSAMAMKKTVVKPKARPRVETEAPKVKETPPKPTFEKPKESIMGVSKKKDKKEKF